MKLCGKDIYLAALEREDCRKLWRDFEYDFDHPAETLNIGHSVQGADKWFEEIQTLQGEKNVRLGVFLNNGEVIGDVALQDIDWKNRSCSVGLGFAKIEHRCKGYGTQAVALMLEHGFCRLGLQRIWAETLDANMAAQKSLEKSGFVCEGRERHGVYFNGEYHDRLHYSILRDEYLTGK